MCIIMVTEAGVPIPDDHLINGWAGNPDGAGYMYLGDTQDNGERELVVRKGLMSFREFQAAYERDYGYYGHDSPFVVHFRIGTHGPNDEANTHPHFVNRRLALAHNGIINGMVYTPKDSRSDTRVFIDNVLRFLPRRWVNNPAILHLVEDYIGVGNKLALLTSDPSIADPVTIINERAGYWLGQRWYSNTSFECGSMYSLTWSGGNPKKNRKVLSYPNAKGKGVSTGAKKKDTKKGAGQGKAQPSDATPTTTSTRCTDTDASARGGVMKHWGEEDADYQYLIQCKLCTDWVDVNADPWCWDCLWCVTCDTDVEPCECDLWKEHIGWDAWGIDYLMAIEAGAKRAPDGTYYEAAGEAVDEDEENPDPDVPRSIHDLTYEEWWDLNANALEHEVVT